MLETVLKIKKNCVIKWCWRDSS